MLVGWNVIDNNTVNSSLLGRNVIADRLLMLLGWNIMDKTQSKERAGKALFSTCSYLTFSKLHTHQRVIANNSWLLDNVSRTVLCWNTHQIAVISVHLHNITQTVLMREVFGHRKALMRCNIIWCHLLKS